MLSRYLAALEFDLGQALPPQDVQARLAEAEAHLREGIASRLELGLDPQAAEREAIAAFGMTRTLARAQHAHDRPSRFRPLVAGLAVVFLTVLLGNSGLLPNPLFDALLAAAALCGLAFAACSFRARRPAPWTVVRIATAALLCFWVGSGLVFLDASAYRSRQGLVPRFAAPRMLANWRDRIAQNEAARPVFEAGWSKVQGNMERLRESGGYRAPFVFPGPISYATVATAREARRQWRYTHEQAEAIFGTATLRRDVDALERARSEPILNLRAVAVLLPGAAVVGAYAVAADLFFGSLGFAAALLQRRRRLA